MCVNLYDFSSALARGLPAERVIEEIDIGGPSLIRAAAKNFSSVAVVTSPSQYASLMQEIQLHGGTSLSTRTNLAAQAFSFTAEYDVLIQKYLHSLANDAGRLFPDSLLFSAVKRCDLRYGENPHQSAAAYCIDQEVCLANTPQMQGKELSYNNLLDADAAFSLVKEYTDAPHACVIVKHNNPCGCATDATQQSAYAHAYACDPQSAFGGILSFSTILEASTAKEIVKQFAEVVIAPGFEPAALDILSSKKNLRVLDCTRMMRSHKTIEYRSILGGVLAQQSDSLLFAPGTQLKSVTHRSPTESETRDLLFAWKVCKHVKSNAVIFARDQRTIGIGAGQMSRVDSCKIAVEKAKNASLTVEGSVLASDAFFPFRDTVDFAAKAGVTAIIQPGGSLRDQESVDAANEAGIAMLYTGTRHFRH